MDQLTARDLVFIGLVTQAVLALLFALVWRALRSGWPGWMALGFAANAATYLAMGAGISPAYLATAEALDSEMRERVESHRRQREGRFETLEEPLALAAAIGRAAARHDVILVDCLTLWITNLLGAGRDVADAIAWMATRPEHVNIDRLTIRPRAQAANHKVYRVTRGG